MMCADSRFRRRISAISLNRSLRTNFTGFLQEVINVAMDKLTNTDHPIIDIAYEVGFNNYTHFSRTFRSITGVAPRDYRRNSRSERERQLYVSELSESS